MYNGNAKYNDVSLNSVFHQGRDNLQRLRDVLMRFRKYPVAFSCDIKEMFMQCGINERYKDSLRIFWFCDHDLDGSITAYRFKRLSYELNCSMSIADYCLKRTVSDNTPNVR